jgi:hypothetical protein
VGNPGLFLIFVPVALLIGVGLPLYCIIDAARRSSQDFVLADSNKTLWVVQPFVFGFLAALVYLAVIRPKLTAV